MRTAEARLAPVLEVSAIVKKEPVKRRGKHRLVVQNIANG